MKAAEVLRRYANRERDFRGANLRGQNFRGQDLSVANFSGADIRSTNFTHASLVGANFTNAKAGLRRRWVIGLLMAVLLSVSISAFLSGYLGTLMNLIFAPGVFNLGIHESQAPVAGWISLAVVVVYCLAIFQRGITPATFVAAVAGAGAVGIAFAIATFVSIEIKIMVVGAGAAIAAGTFIVAVAVAGALTVAGAALVTVPVVIGIMFAGFATGMVASPGEFTNIGLVSGLFGGTVFAISVYVGWRAFEGDSRNSWIQSMAIVFAALGGTSFRGANLTNTNFTKACLKSIDFRRAVLIRTNWQEATKLDRVRPGDTYLSNLKIQTLLTTGNGKGQDFDGLLNLAGLNLTGANLENASFLGSTLKEATLQGANLTGANLILANLNHANLQGANLTNAKLVQTQLDHADLTHATLTGATIEEWGITTATLLDGIHCDYVFMRLPPAEARTDINPHRKPDDWNKTFAEGEFVEFITPMMKTLDLYHNQTVDPRAMALAFNDLRQQHPDANLDIVSMEKRGKNRDKFLIRAEANPDADLSELHSQYFERYDYLRTLTAEALQTLLIEKENHVKMLAGLISTAITKPTTQIETYQNQGDTVMGNKESTNETNLEIGNMAGAINTGGGHATASEFTQNVTNIESKQTLAEAAAEIQTLLKQLETNYAADSATDKIVMAAEAVKQIEANPTFKRKAVAALVAGGTKALEAAIDHPAAAFVVGAIKEWKGH